jgi:hypothetical protein
MTDQELINILDTLKNDWANYVTRFHHLSPDAQSEFLMKQGYNRLADLLAHVIAWWEEGKLVIGHLLLDPCFLPPEYHVDRFNAEAIERVRNLDGSLIEVTFEISRTEFLDFISTLPDEAQMDQKILKRLNQEVIGHLREHALPLEK